MTMGIQDIIAISIAVVAALFAVRVVWRTLNKGGCGGGGCAKKPGISAQATGSSPSPRIIRKPLVTIDLPSSKSGK